MPTKLLLNPCINAVVEYPLINNLTLHIYINGLAQAVWIRWSTTTMSWTVLYPDPGGTQTNCDIINCLPEHPNTTTTYTWNETELFHWETVAKWKCGAPS